MVQKTSAPPSGKHSSPRKLGTLSRGTHTKPYVLNSCDAVLEERVDDCLVLFSVGKAAQEVNIGQG